MLDLYSFIFQNSLLLSHIFALMREEVKLCLGRIFLAGHVSLVFVTFSLDEVEITIKLRYEKRENVSRQSMRQNFDLCISSSVICISFFI